MDDAVRGSVGRGYGKAGNFSAFLNEIDAIAFRVAYGEEAMRKRLLDADVVGLEVALKCGGHREW